MLPEKIRNIIVDLRSRTERGLVAWQYDDNASEVIADQPSFRLSVTYVFDEVEEIGRFNIRFLKKPSLKEYLFSTSQKYTDYELVRGLFDSAQSSDLDIDLDE